jgi:salicylate hydroxylase
MADIVVAGGGIGGLAAALSLAGNGHTVTVLERRDTFTELGAGIQLAPNAFHALDRLGVGDAVRERSVYIDELRFMDGTTGEKVAAMPLTGAYRTRFGNPYVVVHRTDLYAPLLDACRAEPKITLRTNSSVVRYEQNGAGVTVFLETGEALAGDALIGADGIRSTVRAQLVGDGEPRVTGHTIYRSVIPMERVPAELRWNTVTLWAGPKWHFVHYPIGSGRYLNLAATRDDDARTVVTGRPVEKAHVLGQFRNMSERARRLLELGEDWRTWVLCDRDPIDKWTDRRVTLLGDAAHPMLQYAAQGACMALEDAVFLGDLLSCAADEIGQRLTRFDTGRRDRTAKAQWVAREMGRQLYHPAGAEALRRNARLAALSDEDMYGRIAWLHGAREFGAPARTGDTSSPASLRHSAPAVSVVRESNNSQNQGAGMNSAASPAAGPLAAAAGEIRLGGDRPIRRMGYGAMQLAGPGVWGPPTDRDAAVAVLRRAVELGVNHVDTSDYYGPHVVNELIREALHPYPEDLVIVTKVGARRTPDRAWPSALSAAEIRRAVHDNLRRLGVEQLDAVNLRVVEESGGLTPADSIEEPFTALAELREQGLVRHLGLSNISAAQFAEGRRIAPVACVQNEYNVIRRNDEALVKACAADGIAYMPFFPLGTFTLTHDREPGADAKVPLATPLVSHPLETVAKRHEATPYQIALAWLLSRSPVIACIPGTSSLSHLEQNIAAASIRLSDDDLRELDTAADHG